MSEVIEKSQDTSTNGEDTSTGTDVAVAEQGPVTGWNVDQARKAVAKLLKSGPAEHAKMAETLATRGKDGAIPAKVTTLADSMILAILQSGADDAEVRATAAAQILEANVMTAATFAQRSGISEGSVSQLRKAGKFIMAGLLPEGFTAAQLIQACSQEAKKLTGILTNEQKSDDATRAAAVGRVITEARAAKLAEAAAREAVRVAKANAAKAALGAGAGTAPATTSTDQANEKATTPVPDAPAAPDAKADTKGDLARLAGLVAVVVKLAEAGELTKSQLANVDKLAIALSNAVQKGSNAGK